MTIVVMELKMVVAKLMTRNEGITKLVLSPFSGFVDRRHRNVFLFFCFFLFFFVFI